MGGANVGEKVEKGNQGGADDHRKRQEGTRTDLFKEKKETFLQKNNGPSTKTGGKYDGVRQRGSDERKATKRARLGGGASARWEEKERGPQKTGKGLAGCAQKRQFLEARTRQSRETSYRRRRFGEEISKKKRRIHSQ